MDYQALAGMKNSTLPPVPLAALIIFVYPCPGAGRGSVQVHMSVIYLPRFFQFLYPLENRTRPIL